MSQEVNKNSDYITLRQTLFDFENGVIGEEEVKKRYIKWRDQASFGLYKVWWFDGKEFQERFFSFRLAKRGNEVYKNKLKKRLRPFFDKSFQNAVNDTHAVFLTLTWNPEWEGKNIDPWKNISKRWNLWLTKLRKRLGDNYLGVFRVWEATKAGAPHIHAIIFMKEFQWIPKQWITNTWHGVNYIEKVRSPRKALLYLVKYLLKTHENEKFMLTLVMLWFKRKRAFSVLQLFDLIPTKFNSKNLYPPHWKKSIIRDLQSEFHAELVWMGVYYILKPPDSWFFELNQRDGEAAEQAIEEKTPLEEVNVCQIQSLLK